MATPLLYSDKLTQEMASKNQKEAFAVSALVFLLWSYNFKLDAVQSYHSFSHRPQIEKILETSRVPSINRGGAELGKSGFGARAKADALKNTRKTGGGSSVFVNGFVPQINYNSRPVNKPLSCCNNVNPINPFCKSFRIA